MNIGRKILVYSILAIILVLTAYMTVLYYWSYSTGDRSGELIKFSNKGYVFKTWEGELSQGRGGLQIFKFSVLDNEQEVIKQLNENNGKYVKVTYEEKFDTFAWWGDTKYFITKVVKEPIR
jgi:hypothetical protein